ncbi:DUF2914 domain-containing protein [Pseudoalteromonas sp. SMS1]|uniref:DUF2914 domain-containing protein n=1 Tax=Pseudoalteromonas sp. SMS1 TaxID=2908894 RepID=UPI001F21139E|nr:DUF2914 domain-containing protein [Pseudoalteromonas sp. SMS1]MCF2858570.1 DUF2914 domain-containing protein [Pseudoalteromonas sp. SMS1]
MTQRIVIKTKVTDAQSQPKTANSVSYQYHWRRIITVLAMMSFGVMALSYGLFKSVYADDSAAPVSEPVVLASSATEVPVNKIPELQISPSSQAEAHIDSASIVVNEAPSAVAEPEPPVIAVVSVADEMENPSNEMSTDTEHQTAQPELEQSVSTTTRFADDAQVASVALNAKVDTSHISRAVLTSGIENREPVNVLKHLVERNRFEEKLYFFTEIKGLQGEVVQHLWFHQEQLMAEITLPISAPRFRTYSSKNIMPSQTGQWRVEVITQNGQLLAQKSFRILAKAP